MYIKKGDTVIVITGSQKGTIGEVLQCLPPKEKIVIKGVNVRTMHKKPRVQGEKGRIVKQEKPIHISNVAIYDEGKKKGTRVRFNTTDKKKKRMSVISGKKI